MKLSKSALYRALLHAPGHPPWMERVLGGCILGIVLGMAIAFASAVAGVWAARLGIGLAVASVGSIFAATVASALQTGRTSMHNTDSGWTSTSDRRTEPVVFWFDVGFYALIAAGLYGAAVWAVVAIGG